MATDLPKGYRPSEQEPFMNERQREYFRRKLVAWKEDILRESRNTIQNLQSEVTPNADLADRAATEAERQLELRTRDRQRKLISKIDAALRRLEDGSYGFCEETGEPIGIPTPVRWAGITNRYFLLSAVDESAVAPTGLIQTLGEDHGRVSLTWQITNSAFENRFKVQYEVVNLGAIARLVELGALLLDVLDDQPPRLLQRAADQPGVEVVAGLDQRRGRHVRRRVDHAVLDVARLGHGHDQGAARPEVDELDVLQRLLGLGRHHDRGAARKSGKQRRGLLERLVDAAADRSAARLDALAFLLADVADFEQSVDEQPQSSLGRQTPG